MCGICGQWGKGCSEQEVKLMMDAMIHRGPDASGIYASEECSTIFGHRRLSIMDPEGGNQPIFSEAKEAVIVANGEIYNFPALRKELVKHHTLRTTSDTESALHLYQDHGRATVEHIDGMYAFAIGRGGDLFLARDPIGIKPLYYGQDGDKLVFASELNAISSCCDYVREFPPGTMYSPERGFETFYEVPDIQPEDKPEEQFIAEIRETLTASVQKRLMSDVPLGAFLSGGLDSSLIVAIARQLIGHKIHTFSVGFENSPDLQAARMLSGHLDTIHHEYVLTPQEVLMKIPEIIYHLESFDRDLVRSAIPCYFTSRLAAEEVKVILTGEGADELFAGYTYYKDIDDIETVLHRELRRSVSSLHNVNLQRVDRLTMAHSIEGRVPFLDLKMIELGQKIPARHKLRGKPPVEKWILRKSFENLLPDEILWRKKAQFDEGSGTVDALDGVLADTTRNEDVEARNREFPGAGLRCAEEAYYHRIFMDVFSNPKPVATNVARWAERPDLSN